MLCYSRDLDDERKRATDEMKGKAKGAHGRLTAGPAGVS